MCDQDHFEKDRLAYERLGQVTRKQFGILLGAGSCVAGHWVDVLVIDDWRWLRWQSLSVATSGKV